MYQRTINIDNSICHWYFFAAKKYNSAKPGKFEPRPPNRGLLQLEKTYCIWSSCCFLVLIQLTAVLIVSPVALTWIFIQPLFPPYDWLRCFECSSVPFLFQFLYSLFTLRSIAICMSVLGCLYVQAFALPKPCHHRELIPFSTVSGCLTCCGRKSPRTFFRPHLWEDLRRTKAHEGLRVSHVSCSVSKAFGGADWDGKKMFLDLPKGCA